MTPSSKFPKLKEDSAYLNTDNLTDYTTTPIRVDIEGDIERMRTDIRSLNSAIVMLNIVVLGLVAILVYFITQSK